MLGCVSVLINLSPGFHILILISSPNFSFQQVVIRPRTIPNNAYQMHGSTVKTKILYGLVSICCYLTSRSAVQWTSTHATYSQLPFGIYIVFSTKYAKHRRLHFCWLFFCRPTVEHSLSLSFVAATDPEIATVRILPHLKLF